MRDGWEAQHYSTTTELVQVVVEDTTLVQAIALASLMIGLRQITGRWFIGAVTSKVTGAQKVPSTGLAIRINEYLSIQGACYEVTARAGAKAGTGDPVVVLWKRGRSTDKGTRG